MRNRSIFIVVIGIAVSMLMLACAPTVTPVPDEDSDDHAATEEHSEGESHGGAPVHQASTDTPPLTIELNPGGGLEIGSVYEAWLSPHQEPGEEQDTPGHIPDQFRATAPMLLRSERDSIGHGILRFTRDLSRVFIDVAIENVDPEEIVMFHIHCGRPDMLGPIIVDFSLATDIQDNFEDGVFSVEITNEIIEATADSGEGMIGEFTMGCPIPASLALELGQIDKAKTVAGLEYIARQGELYFNLHTAGQVYFGDMRGQIYQIDLP